MVEGTTHDGQITAVHSLEMTSCWTSAEDFMMRYSWGFTLLHSKIQCGKCWFLMCVNSPNSMMSCGLLSEKSTTDQWGPPKLAHLPMRVFPKINMWAPQNHWFPPSKQQRLYDFGVRKFPIHPIYLSHFDTRKAPLLVQISPLYPNVSTHDCWWFSHNISMKKSQYFPIPMAIKCQNTHEKMISHCWCQFHLVMSLLFRYFPDLHPYCTRGHLPRPLQRRHALPQRRAVPRHAVVPRVPRQRRRRRTARHRSTCRGPAEHRAEHRRILEVWNLWIS